MRPYLAMECLAGEDLAEQLRRLSRTTAREAPTVLCAPQLSHIGSSRTAESESGAVLAKDTFRGQGIDCFVDSAFSLGGQIVCNFDQ